MTNSYKIILGLLALAGVFTLVVINVSSAKTDTPSTRVLASLGIGSTKTDKKINNELEDLKSDYLLALNKINSLESKTGLATGSGLTLNNFRFTETSVSGEPNKLIIQAKNGSTWDDAQTIDSVVVNP